MNFSTVDANNLFCSLVENVDESGRPGLIVYLPVTGEIPETLKMTVEDMVSDLLASCYISELAAVAVENMTELPADGQTILLAQLPVHIR